ncbi:porin family protein [Novosphingobium profundi]|uniref:outer membrane protein n=1 Tax=Novosphingobium profundi TaxID=1774954 RepID=UPI001BDB4703|nr:porin family protein [Novosphingobium profundi]MBT0667347.1 porin family protein [Novosphingobium profundi]
MKAFVTSAITGATFLFANQAIAAPFQGAFLGVHAGWNEDRVHGAQTDLGEIPVRETGDKFVGGLFAGYDQRITRHIVIGGEAGFDIAADDRIGEGARYIDPSYTFDVTGRVGYVTSPKTLVYLRGGYENTRARVVNGALRGHDNFDGWTAGAGLDREILENVSASLEYRYSDLGSAGHAFDRHQVLAALAYHF